MPISEKQLAANRANALKSKGPKTVEGKANSAGNRRVHGFRASDQTLDAEHDEVYEAILSDLVRDFNPEDSFELTQLTAMADAEWRCRRALRNDTGLTSMNFGQMSKTRASLTYTDDPPRDDPDTWNDPDFLARRENRVLGETFSRCSEELLRNANYLAKFRRYYDNAYSKLIVHQDIRRRQEASRSPRSNKPAA